MKIKTLHILSGLLVLIFLSVEVFAQEGTVKSYLEQILPPQEGRKIVLSEAAGMLTITDTPSNHRIIKRILKAIDIGPRQVMIEARMVEIKSGFLEEKGIDWYWYKGNDRGEDPRGDRQPRQAWTPGNVYSGSNFVQSGAMGPQEYINRPTDWAQVPYFTGGDTLASLPKDNNKSNLSNVSILPGGINMSMPFASKYGFDLLISKTSFGGSYLRAYIHMLEEDGTANLLSCPKLTTLSGEQASIELTRNIPYIRDVEAENVGSADWPRIRYNLEIAEKTIGIKLAVTPFVSGASDIIRLEIEPEIVDLLYQAPISALHESGSTAGVTQDVIGAVGLAPGIGEIETVTLQPGSQLITEEMGWPAVAVRNVSATVYVESGETIVLGGLIRDTDKKIEKKIPFLGHIPLLGGLFRYKYTEHDKRNLVIFITATIITPEGDMLQ